MWLFWKNWNLEPEGKVGPFASWWQTLSHPTEGKCQGIADILAMHRDEILRLAEKHGAYNVRVFGSVARGEASDASDVDFLVDWDYTRLSSWGGVGLNLELEELLGRRVDISTEKTLHWSIRDEVVAEAVPL